MPMADRAACLRIGAPSRQVRPSDRVARVRGTLALHVAARALARLLAHPTSQATEHVHPAARRRRLTTLKEAARAALQVWFADDDAQAGKVVDFGLGAD